MTPAIRCASPPVLRQIVYVMQVLLSFLARQHREHDGLPLASMSGTSLEQMYIIKKAKCPGLWPIFRVRCTKFLHEIKYSPASYCLLRRIDAYTDELVDKAVHTQIRASHPLQKGMNSLHIRNFGYGSIGFGR